MERNYIYYLFIVLIISLAIHLLGPYYPVYLYQSGLSIGIIGLLKSLSLFSSGLFAFLAGAISDKYGRVKGGRLGLMLSSIGIFFIVFFVRILWALIIAFLLIGIGNPFLGSFEAWIADEYKKARKIEELRKLFSKARVVTSTAALLAGIIGTFLSYYNLSLPLIASVFSLLLGLIFSFVFYENYGLESVSESLNKGVVLFRRR